ncbi:S8 family serine peptidase [Xanthomonadaceae bacterium JHOS43]|nr:S8 family serine peptidase [Xanthomonadaceae bacterium JHOS43]
MLSLAVALALPAAAQASGPECLVSFAGAQMDVCSGKTSATTAGLAQLLSLDGVKDSTLRLVKFAAPITAPQRAALDASGARIIDYAPHYAYIVRMSPGLDREVARLDGVIWAGPLLPALKIDPNLQAEIAGARIVEELGIESLTIGFDPRMDVASVRSSIAAVPGLRDVRSVTVGGEQRLVAGFDRAQLASSVAQLALESSVLSIGFDRPKRLANSQADWLHQSNIGTPSRHMPVFDQGIYGCGQIIGELDTGLHLDNVAFKDASQTTPVSVCDDGSGCLGIAAPNNAARKVIAYYKWSGDAGASWADEHGHGTHVAGSILGNNNVANPGVDCVNYTTPGGHTDLDGTAPGAKLVMQESGSDLRYLNNTGGTVYHAAQIAYDNGARLHSNSWGGGCTNLFGACVAGCTVTYDQEARDADRVMTDYDDLLLVFAAGNDATACPNGNNVGSPGNAKNVLTVGATLRGSSANGMASFSSRGPTLDSRTKPDIATQGSSIMSASRSASGTTSMSGTSMATPTAAGLAALVREYLQRGFYPTGAENSANAIPDPSGALIKAMMVAGTTAMTGTGAGAFPGQAQGWGRALLDNVLYFQGDQQSLYLHDADEGLSSGTSQIHLLTVMEGQPLSVVLAWSDAPAAINASPATVNQLRLEVVAPNGDVWTQKLPATYNVNNANPTQGTSTANYDTINTVQRIVLQTPQMGVYQLRVRGINVPGAEPQNYALVATGNMLAGGNPDFVLGASPSSVEACAGGTAQMSIDVFGLADYDDPVGLSALGLPAGASGSFSVNPVVPALPPANSMLSIATTSAVAGGSHGFLVEGVSGALTHSAAGTLKVDEAAPGAVSLSAPANDASDVATMPVLSWGAVSGAARYRVQVAVDAGFAAPLVDEVVTTTSHALTTMLAPNTRYYWRVMGENACGEGIASATYHFRTANLICRTPAVVIPDGSASGINDSMTIADTGNLLGLKVVVKATHTYVGDLKFTLSRGVQSVVLVDRPGVPASTYGCNGDNVDIVLDDAATAVVETMCNGTPPALAGDVKPHNPINTVFAGQPFNGTWTLNASDNVGSDTGTLTEWCLMPVLDASGYTVGGTVTGLAAAGLVLGLNGDESLPIASDGAFTFDAVLADGAGYDVVVEAQPEGQHCSVEQASGTIADADVTDVAVVCQGSTIFTDGFEQQF